MENSSCCAWLGESDTVEEMGGLCSGNRGTLLALGRGEVMYDAKGKGGK